MSRIENNAYFIYEDENGLGYLCPLSSVKKRDTVTGGDLDDCVEKDIVERYSGNINVIED